MTRTRRVLCVNIDPDICDLITTVLEPDETVSVRSEDAALVETLRKNFDLYLLNDSLDDGTGLELCKVIRAFDRGAIVLILTDSQLLKAEDVQAVGAFGVVYQRELPHSLIDAVRKLFR